VLYEDERMVGWMRLATAGELGRFDVMADPVNPGLDARLADDAIARLRGQEKLLTLAPEFAAGLIEHLSRRGFDVRGEYVVMAKRTLQPISVAEPELAPATTA
jgi:hypothetical protein